MTKLDSLIEHLNQTFVSQSEFDFQLPTLTRAFDEVTMVCDLQNLHHNLMQLRDLPPFAFDQLIDLCGVDYLEYGIGDWETEAATETGFCRGREEQPREVPLATTTRFAVVYHLLSTKHNHRLRVKVYLDEKYLMLPSACVIWKAANWFEREAYDLYGILFDGHPDLRRILTDYGFIGHPFRKDFPLIGTVEMRYDATLEKVIYEPVSIENRVSVPKVIREDNRYLEKIGGKA